MKFTTQQKEYEIEYKRIGHFNGKSTPVFKLIISKPFQLETVFDINDISIRQNVEGIRFYSFSDIAKMLNSKQEVLFSLTPDALRYVRETAADTINSIKEAAQNKTVEKWYWAIGGDTHDLYVSADIDTEFRKDIREIEYTIAKTRGRGNILQMLRDNSILSERKTALYTDGWYEISNDDMMKVYNISLSQEDEIGKIEKAKQEKREEEKMIVFEKARTTGKKQLLYKTFDECDDPREECSMDEILVYAMPDGSEKTERYHTY